MRCFGRRGVASFGLSLTYEDLSCMGSVFTNLFVAIGILLPLCGIRISANFPLDMMYALLLLVHTQCKRMDETSPSLALAGEAGRKAGLLPPPLGGVRKMSDKRIQVFATRCAPLAGANAKQMKRDFGVEKATSPGCSFDWMTIVDGHLRCLGTQLGRKQTRAPRQDSGRGFLR
jgi:hypothetical protein